MRNVQSYWTWRTGGLPTGSLHHLATGRGRFSTVTLFLITSFRFIIFQSFLQHTELFIFLDPIILGILHHIYTTPCTVGKWILFWVEKLLHNHFSFSLQIFCNKSASFNLHRISSEKCAMQIFCNKSACYEPSASSTSVNFSYQQNFDWNKLKISATFT